MKLHTLDLALKTKRRFCFVTEKKKTSNATLNLLKMYFLLSYRGRKRFVSEGDGGRLKLESYWMWEPTPEALKGKIDIYIYTNTHVFLVCVCIFVYTYIYTKILRVA